MRKILVVSLLFSSVAYAAPQPPSNYAPSYYGNEVVFWRHGIGEHALANQEEGDLIQTKIDCKRRTLQDLVHYRSPLAGEPRIKTGYAIVSVFHHSGFTQMFYQYCR